MTQCGIHGSIEYLKQKEKEKAMTRGLEPRPRTVGKCTRCGLVVREGNDKRDVFNDLFHRDCAAAMQRELDAWNNDVKADRAAKA